MFDAAIYAKRREELAKRVNSGLILLPGNDESAMNYPGNPYHFRQDSSFLYYFGNPDPGLIGVVDADSGESILFGDDVDVDDIIWMGPQETIRKKGKKTAVNRVKPTGELEPMIKKALADKRKVHYLPQYRGTTTIKVAGLVGSAAEEVNNKTSSELIKAVVAQRNIKSEEEIKEIEKALSISYNCYKLAMKISKPGLVEQEVCGALEGLILSRGSYPSFPIIFSVHGETLHNHHHDNIMNEGDLLVLDSGAESPENYASDITRTFPVNGTFILEQKEIYQIVLDSQLEAISMMKPGVTNREAHLHSARVITEGLKGMGLMQGDTEEAVQAGAHALFMPHGLGHMLGLDVHDMEGLGEDYVGYGPMDERSDQFGLAYLRMAREYEPGYVVTVEPGIYFIPELIDKWKSEKMHIDFINYNKVEAFRGFGGIRIEDDVLITPEGHRVLGKPIAKTVEEIEEWCRG